ncbi:MAG TPA: HEAT repeat domain-containing protein [Gemmataceae bacterium]|jgi:hypothetical protein
MSWSRTLLVPLVLAALAPPAPAGLLSRKTKPDPATRVPELTVQLKTSTDEAQRAAAAEELRQYDPKAHPNLVTALIDALGRDASPAVRAEAATSLGKLRPISQQAGYALEQAQNNDAAARVRLAARQALWQYHLVGYRGGKAPDAPAMGATTDPAVAAPPGPSSPAAMPRQPADRGGQRRQPGNVRETPEPPLAAPPVAPPSGATASRQPPAAPSPPNFIPANPALRQPAASRNDAPPKPPTVPDDGPALPPP